MMEKIEIQDFTLWDKLKEKRMLLSFELELTARCNNNCRHCYINLPAGDRKARDKELSLEEIRDIAEEAASMGALWCLLTGGEPLLRGDFSEIYLMLKKMGFLLSVFTNATLVSNEHIRLFKKYPPRDIEVTLYGATRDTYERVTRRPGTFDAFMHGLDLLLGSGVKVRLKAMALRSNMHEMEAIARFCRERTKDYYRFDPQLHLRFDRDPVRNQEIMDERLTSEEFVALERSDEKRFGALKKDCDTFINSEFAHFRCGCLFHCGAGNGSFNVSYEGLYRLCSSLCHPDCVYDLKKGSIRDAWENHVPKVRAMQSESREFREKCRKCPIINLCMWCPALSYLETGELDTPVDYFCRVAHARTEAIQTAESSPLNSSP